jgi:hypothetical protein
MFSIEKRTVPAKTMLDKYLVNGAYTDCYMTEISGSVSFSEYIFSFYTTPLFKIERLILKLTVSKPSTDVQARQLAEGEINTFAAWHVEDRSENQMLMCDFLGRTRSWFKVIPISQTRTQLYFGSAVSSRQNPTTGKLSLGFGFRALLGFHKIYSMLLLYSARSRI